MIRLQISTKEQAETPQILEEKISMDCFFFFFDSNLEVMVLKGLRGVCVGTIRCDRRKVPCFIAPEYFLLLFRDCRSMTPLLVPVG